MSEGMPTEKPWRKRAFWVRCLGGALAGFVGALVIAVLGRLLNEQSVLLVNALLASGLGLEAGLLVYMAQIASAVPQHGRKLTVAAAPVLAASLYGLYSSFPATLFQDWGWALQKDLISMFAKMVEEMGYAAEAARLRRAFPVWTITQILTVAVVIASALWSMGRACRLRDKLKVYALGLGGALLVRAALPAAPAPVAVLPRRAVGPDWVAVVGLRGLGDAGGRRPTPVCRKAAGAAA